ncbi:thiol:disulfide interchange protein DsbA/DsbL [uncultured Thiohalocapsa sp.]|uniref:thiol:disulfide interchange protein DsbA/DsbL n=1 Tax=uncultured Thiohalocapsa sp. TaxID=768990 RepID=UPI0025EA131D|nr:thiol:disulfide interchange protein DsbA/DsbL [uncultured Thiohalocapsa sp.]
MNTQLRMLRRVPLPARAGMLLALLLLALAAAAAESFDEGIDYRLVAEPARAEAGDDVEVLEFFWYGCPHCWQLEPQIKRWLDDKPAGVSFRRLPAAASPRWVPHAKAYFAAEQLGELDKLHEPLFKALHDERRKIFTEDQIIAFAAEQGIDAAKFRAAYNSFPVDMQVRKSADLVRRYRIDGVPSMVVNGKYVTSATQTGSNTRMFEVIDHLVARESGGDAGSQPAQAAPATDAGAS